MSAFGSTQKSGCAPDLLGRKVRRNANRSGMASAAARLLRAYAAQTEALRRLRNGGSQIVRVEQVHVNEGGQAVIGKRETCAQFRKAMSS
jgi:hypothetical protein